MAQPIEFDCRDVVLRGEWWLAATEPVGTVVLSHGGGQTRHAWKQTAPWLAALGWNALAIDLRGHGDSEWSPDGKYSLDLFARDLSRVVETIEEPPVLIGASLGGTSSLMYAGEAGAHVRALVLVDIVPRVEPGGSRRIKEFMAAQPSGFACLQDAVEAMKAYNPHRKTPPSEGGLRRNLRQSEDGRWRWHWDPSFLDLPDEPLGGDRSHRVYRAARALDVPALLVRGAHSDIVSDEGEREFLSLVRDSRSVTVDAGHMVAGDDNHIFSTSVSSFLESLGS